MNKVWVIERSLRCRRYGYWCLVPVAGLIGIVEIFVRWRQIRSEVAGGWNPAAGALRWGLTLAIIGSLISLATLVIIILALLKTGPFE